MQGADVSSVVLIGCDGGYQGGGYCSPVMRSLSGNAWSWPPITAPPQALHPHRSYQITVTFYAPSNTVLWSLANSFGEHMFTFSGNVPGLNQLTQGGLLLGRSGLTCVDDFRLDFATD